MNESALHGRNGRVVVCGAGAVVVDLHRVVPYAIVGCMVGEPARVGGHDYLVGLSFVTRIEREDARWPRDQAPSPCPHCGYAEK